MKLKAIQPSKTKKYKLTDPLCEITTYPPGNVAIHANRLSKMTDRNREKYCQDFFGKTFAETLREIHSMIDCKSLEINLPDDI